MAKPLVRHCQTSRFSVIGCATDIEDKTSSKQTHIFLDIDEPYTRRLIQEAFSHGSRRPHFCITLGPAHGMDAIPLPKGCHFQWAEYERIDWDAVRAGSHGASSYCIRKGLSRKAQLAYHTRRHVAKNPDSILRRAIPHTVILDTWPVFEEEKEGGRRTSTNREGLADIVCSIGLQQQGGSANRRELLDQCLKEAKQVMEREEELFEKSSTASDAPVWIMKGSTVNKGDGIYIVHCYEQVVDICWSETDIREWVLQRYISSPLLLRERKFHIRAYALAVSDLRVYLCRECLALCSGTKYRKNDTSNVFAHITNTAYQEVDPNFREDQCVLLWGDDDIASIFVQAGTCLNRSEALQRMEKVVKDMEAITAELFRAYENEFGVFSPIQGCFEHYGLDFMVDCNWQVLLLEINPGPDFKQTGNKLSPAISRLMGSTIDVALRRPQKSAGNLELVYERPCRARELPMSR